MKRSILLCIAVIVMLSIAVMPAAAGRTWCSADPLVKLPDGRVVSIIVSVPDDHVSDKIRMDIWAPKGSKIVGYTDGLDIKAELHPSPAKNVIKAEVHEKFPIMLSAQLDGASLGKTFTFDKGKGTAVWNVR